MRSWHSALVDLLAAGGLLYCASWIYELGNLVTLSLFASQATLVMVGPVPIAVTAVSAGTSVPLLVKPLQVGLTSGAMFALFWAVRARKLPISEAVSITMVAIFLASGYWEMLSLLSSLSYGIHLAIFSALALGARVGLSRIFRR